MSMVPNRAILLFKTLSQEPNLSKGTREVQKSSEYEYYIHIIQFHIHLKNLRGIFCGQIYGKIYPFQWWNKIVNKSKQREVETG